MGTGAKDRLILAEPPKSTPKNFDQMARDHAWALVHWFRLFDAYESEQYRDMCRTIVKEIQALQDEATAAEKSLAEQEDADTGELTSHMGRA